MTKISFKQDLERLHNKVRIVKPLLCDGDGPMHKLREWYNQFYLDRSEVSPALSKTLEWESNLS